MKKKNKKKGRPSIYTKEIATKICRRIAEGESLQGIMKDKDLPNRDTFYEWLEKKDLSDRYTNARRRQADFYSDEIINIADNVGLTNEEINKARLRMDARKWIACKLHPRNYGDKGVTINHNTQVNIHEKYVLEQYDVKEIEEE